MLQKTKPAPLPQNQARISAVEAPSGMGAARKPGQIFLSGKSPGRQMVQRYIANEKARLERGKKDLWGQWDTPLCNYAMPLHLRLDSYLEAKAAEARKAGRKLWVLDVGMGSGRQWAEFLRRNQGVRFFGTVLNLEAVCPEMRLHAVFCDAASLDVAFAGMKFDAVVSRMSMYRQEAEGLSAMHRILGPEGEAIVSAWKEIAEGVNAAVEGGLYKIMAPKPGPLSFLEQGFSHKAFHLRKREG